MNYDKYFSQVTKIINASLMTVEGGEQAGEKIKAIRAKAISQGMIEAVCKEAENDAICTAMLLCEYAKNKRV